MRLVSWMRSRGFDAAGLAEEPGGPDYKVVIAHRQRGVVAGELQFSCVAMRQVERVENRQWADEAFDFMKTVVSSPQDAERKVDLGRSEKLHGGDAGGAARRVSAYSVPRSGADRQGYHTPPKDRSRSA